MANETFAKMSATVKFVDIDNKLDGVVAKTGLLAESVSRQFHMPCWVFVSFLSAADVSGCPQGAVLIFEFVKI